MYIKKIRFACKIPKQRSFNYCFAAVGKNKQLEQFLAPAVLVRTKLLNFQNAEQAFLFFPFFKVSTRTSAVRESRSARRAPFPSGVTRAPHFSRACLQNAQKKKRLLATFGLAKLLKRSCCSIEWNTMSASFFWIEFQGFLYPS